DVVQRRTFIGSGAAIGGMGLLAACTDSDSAGGGPSDSGGSDGAGSDGPASGSATRPRIGLAGIHIESSTFSPQLSSEDDFTVSRGTEEILDRFPFFDADSPSGQALREAADYVGVLHARASPGGALETEVYEGWKQEITEGLAAAHEEDPLDGFFFDIHGAMSVDGMDDAEGDLITAIRDVIGPDVVVGTAMDPHEIGRASCRERGDRT